MPRNLEEYDFEKGVFRSKCDKKTLEKLKKIKVIQALDAKGTVVVTFQKVVEA